MITHVSGKLKFTFDDQLRQMVEQYEPYEPDGARSVFERQRPSQSRLADFESGRTVSIEYGDLDGIGFSFTGDDMLVGIGFEDEYQRSRLV